MLSTTYWPQPLLNQVAGLAQARHKVRPYLMNACGLNNDHFLKAMPHASSRASVLGILTADIIDLPTPPQLPGPLKSCQGGAKIKVSTAEAGKVHDIGAIRGQPVLALPRAGMVVPPCETWGPLTGKGVK